MNDIAWFSQMITCLSFWVWLNSFGVTSAQIIHAKGSTPRIWKTRLAPQISIWLTRIHCMRIQMHTQVITNYFCSLMVFSIAIKIVHINILNRFMSRQEITSGIRQGSADWMEHWNVINPILPSSWFGHLSKTNSNGRIRSGLGLEQPWKYL